MRGFPSPLGRPQVVYANGITPQNEEGKLVLHFGTITYVKLVICALTVSVLLCLPFTPALASTGERVLGKGAPSENRPQEQSAYASTVLGFTTPTLQVSGAVSLSVASLLQPIQAASPQLAALNEAITRLGEGDRLKEKGNKTDARAKWEEAAKAYIKAADQLGAADAYLRLADSYQLEAIFSVQKRRLAIEYYLKALTASADVYETLIQKELHFDPDKLKRADGLYTEAVQDQRAGNCRAAVPLLRQARQLYASAGKAEAQGFGSGIVRTLVMEAICQMDAGDYFSSLTTLLSGLVIAESLPLGTPTTERFLEAKHQYEQGNFPEALKIYAEVLKVYQQGHDEESIAQTLLDMGVIYGQLGQYPDAENSIKQALALFSKHNNEYTAYNLAAAHHNLGNLATIAERYDEAASEFEQAIQLWKENSNPTYEMISLSGLGLALRGQGRYAEAIQVLQNAQTQQQALSHAPETEGDLLNNLGYVYYSLGRYMDADAVFQQALQQYRQLPQPQRTQKELATQNNWAAVQANTGHFAEAQQTYQQLLAFANNNDQPLLAAQVNVNLAGIALQRGEYQTGIALYLKALPVFEKHGMPYEQTAVEQNIGAAYLKLGDLVNSEVYMTKALAVFKENNNRDGIAALQNNLGLLFAQAGRYAQAKAAFTEAMTIWQALGNAASASRASANQALIAVAQGDVDAALAQSKAALQLSAQSGLQADQVRILIILSIAQLKHGDTAAGQASAQQALALATKIGDPVAEMGSHLLLAMTYLATKQLSLADDHVQLADEHVQKAIDQLESLQGALTVAELKTTFLGQLANVYELAVLIALANQQPDKAFLYTEQARARAFLDQLANQHLDFRQRAGADALQKEQALRQQSSKLQQALTNERAKPLSQQTSSANIEQELEAARTDYAKLLVELKVTDPEYVALVSQTVLSLSQIQQMLDNQTTLIVYFTLDDKLSDKTLAWVIERQQVQMLGLDITSKDLQTQVEFLHQSLVNKQQASDPSGLAQASGQLYDRLFSPLKPYIHHPNLVLAPHGVLHYLPFAALWDAKAQRYLVEDYALTYTPSASALKFIQAKRNRNEGRLLVLGNPSQDLTQAETEAKQIAEFYGVKPLLKTEATESQVVAQASQIDLLHLAAHGIYNPFNPLFTRIELAPSADQDGNLEVQEVYGLNLANANLVVLSACESGEGVLSNGDDIVGLPQAFLYAGAPAVVTSLWKIDDVASSTLMIAFYRHLRAGETTATALQAAQKEVLAQAKWRSPYYWAAFSLNGDDQGNGTQTQ